MNRVEASSFSSRLAGSIVRVPEASLACFRPPGVHFPRGTRDLSLHQDVQTGCGVHPVPSGYRGAPSPEIKWPEREADHLRLMPWIRMSGDVPVLPLYAFVPVARDSFISLCYSVTNPRCEQA